MNIVLIIIGASLYLVTGMIVIRLYMHWRSYSHVMSHLEQVEIEFNAGTLAIFWPVTVPLYILTRFIIIPSVFQITHLIHFIVGVKHRQKP